MSFHVEVGRSFRRARAFNLDEAQLRATVLEPWSRGELVELGEREWDPRDADLTVIEGPHLDTADLAHGQGWHRATKTGSDVTSELLAAPSQAVAVVAADDATAAVRSLIEELGYVPVEWPQLRARLVGSGTAEVSAAVVVLGSATIFDAGLALGAFGKRAIAVLLRDEPLPAELAGVPVIQLDDGAPAKQALAERLAGPP